MTVETVVRLVAMAVFMVVVTFGMYGASILTMRPEPMRTRRPAMEAV